MPPRGHMPSLFIPSFFNKQSCLVEFRDILTRMFCAALALSLLLQSQSGKVSGRVPSDLSKGTGTVPQAAALVFCGDRNYSRTIYPRTM